MSSDSRIIISRKTVKPKLNFVKIRRVLDSVNLLFIYGIRDDFPSCSRKLLAEIVSNYKAYTTVHGPRKVDRKVGAKKTKQKVIVNEKNDHTLDRKMFDVDRVLCYI